jgi:hypothetical protein
MTNERDLSGRCGTCGFFMALRTDGAGAREGECRLGCWPSPLRDTGTCPSHKPLGQPFQKRPVASAPTRRRSITSNAAEADERTPPLPKEIDLDMDLDDFRDVLRQVLREELGIDDAPLADRWRGGELVLKPGKDGTQPKSVPIDVFFKKIVGVRDKLRVLEQKVNGSDSLSNEEKLTLQGYITGCYGSMTSFNVLFRDRDDWFVGAGKDD